MFPSSKSSFFQIMTEDDFPHNRLQLRPDFVQRHTEKLYKESGLKTICSGHTWDVKIEQLTSIEGEPCCFTNGWSEFARDARLKVGESVLFWFNEVDSTFDVAAYEIGGSQKRIWNSDSQVKSEPVDNNDDDDVEDQDGASDEQFSGSEDLEDQTQSEAESEDQDGASDELLSGSEDSETRDQTQSEDQDGASDDLLSGSEDSETRDQTQSEDQDGASEEMLSGSEDSETHDHIQQIQSEAEFDSHFPHKFEAILKRPFDQYVTLNFAEVTGLLREKSVTLEYPPKDRYWSVLLYVSPNYGRSRLYIGSGWRKFREENGLKIGDTCSFVFNAAKNVIQVMRINESPNDRDGDDVPGKKRKRPIATKPTCRVPKLSSSISRGCRENSMTYRMAKAFMDEKTIHKLSFVCYMHRTYLTRSCLNLPPAIMRDNFQNERNTLRLRVSNGKKGKSWAVVESHHPRSKARLTGGWGRFVEDNAIKLGDACVFEMNKSDLSEWKVTIFRK